MIHFSPWIFSGVKASSAVTSVLYLHNEVGNQAEMSSGAYIYCGDAASFHEWLFRIAGKTGDQYIEAMSKVSDGLRGDVFVAAREVGLLLVGSVPQRVFNPEQVCEG